MMQFLTDFADQAVILPALTLACLTLALTGWRRAALALAAAAAAAGAAILVGKVTISGCPALAANDLDLHSPSGHTAMAAVLYGTVPALWAPKRRRTLVALLAATAAAAIFGASRLALHVHTIADVVAGATIGIAGATTAAAAAGPPPARRSGNPAVILLLAPALLFHGQHLQTERALHAFAARLIPASLCRADPTRKLSATAIHYFIPALTIL